MRRFPRYYQKFQCTASACTDNCCIGWEIDIDPSSLERYLQAEGDFGALLRQHILQTPQPHFRLDAEGRCPFLDAQNLCGLYRQLGEDALCEICTHHPRFYAAHGGLQDCGVGLCCEEAARLLLTEDTTLCLEEDGIPLSQEPQFVLLLNAQETALFLLQQPDLTVQEGLALLLAFGEELQPLLEARAWQQGMALCTAYHTGDWPDLFPAKAAPAAIYGELCDFFIRLEPLDPQWPNRLRTLVQSLPELLPLQRTAAGYSTAIQRLGGYLLHRYLLDACDSGDFAGYCRMTASCCLLVELLLHHDLQDRHSLQGQVRLLKDFSKEVEYSTDNMQALLDACWQQECFSTPALLRLLL